jgi:hypothetical protein
LARAPAPSATIAGHDDDEDPAPVDGVLVGRVGFDIVGEAK